MDIKKLNEQLLLLEGMKHGLMWVIQEAQKELEPVVPPVQKETKE